MGQLEASACRQKQGKRCFHTVEIIGAMEFESALIRSSLTTHSPTCPTPYVPGFVRPLVLPLALAPSDAPNAAHWLNVCSAGWRERYFIVHAQQRVTIL